MILYETISGNLIDIESEKIDMSGEKLEDIIWLMARKRRFNDRIDYTVSEHSEWMARQTKDILIKLYCLVHDMAEVISGDIPSPVLELLGKGNRIKELQRKILSSLLERYGLPEMSEEHEREVKRLDLLSLFLEKKSFLPNSMEWPNESSFESMVSVYQKLVHEERLEKRISDFHNAFENAMTELSKCQS